MEHAYDTILIFKKADYADSGMKEHAEVKMAGWSDLSEMTTLLYCGLCTKHGKH